MILAGPATNLFIGSLAFLIMSREALPAMYGRQWLENPAPGFMTFFGDRLVPLHLIFLSNLIVVVLNLWPRKINNVATNGKIFSDGLAMLKAPFLSSETVNLLLSSYYLSEASESFQAKDYQGALRWCEHGLSRYPNNEALINLMGVFFIHMRKFVEARNCFKKLVGGSARNPGFHALLLNNIAYVDVLIGGDGMLEEADRYSKQALAACPWLSFVKGTRGTVLVELGQVEEGILLLREAMQNDVDSQSKALNAVHIAFAERKRGNLEECKRYLESARALDPDCYLLDPMLMQRWVVGEKAKEPG
jgi:tetratricopeptide (TPR) repeat protein